jgi:hypothetical protein
MALPRTALLSGTVSWSNGDLFDGYVLLALSLPSGYTYASPIGSWPNSTLPQFVRIPITAGAFSQQVAVFWNEDLEPPNCRYCAYWYDAQDTLLSGPSAIFDIGASPYAITIPTLTVPAASGTQPTPPSAPS